MLEVDGPGKGTLLGFYKVVDVDVECRDARKQTHDLPSVLV